MKELVFTILDLQLDDSCLFYFYIPSIDSVWPAYNKMFLCIMYLCVFVMAVCPIFDVLRYSRSEHKPLNYFLSTLLQRNLRFMQYPFFLPRAVFPASPWPLLTILFSFYKIPFYPVVKKEFFIPKQKKLLKKVKNFILLYEWHWLVSSDNIWLQVKVKSDQVRVI